MAELFDSYTKACGHFDGANGATAYTDPIAGAYTFYDAAQLSTSAKKFGTASLFLNGTGDYVTLADSASWNFGSGDFTIDFWIRWSDASGSQWIYSQRPDGSNFVDIYSDGSSLWFMSYSGGVAKANYTTDNLSLSGGEWYHFAVVRNGSNVYIFKNGVSRSLTTTTAIGANSLPDLAATLCIGRPGNTNSYYLLAWVDEFRVSKGIARWTSNFTPPTAAYSGIALTDSSTISTTVNNAANRILPAETITPTSSLGFNYGFNKSLSDTVALTDEYARIWNIVHILVESVTLTDAYSRVWDMQHSLSDTMTLTEIINSATARSISDTVSVVERLQEWLDKNPKPTTWSAVSAGSGTWTKVTPGTDIWTHVS